MTKWNPQQEKAIYTMDKNILVSASAGSGKTTVLIARLLHLVKDKRIPIDRILAMTFTEAAANEMKKRLAKELQLALKESKDKEEKSYLNKQLANMSKASISTIHGFCLNIIQNDYYAIGLNKEAISNIMDDATQSILLKKSMDKTFAYFISNEHFLTLCQMFSTKADSDVALKEAITSLFYLAVSKSDAHTFLSRCYQHEITSIQQYDEQIQMYFFDYLQVQIDSIMDALIQARYYYDDLKDIEIIEQKLLTLKKCSELIQKNAYREFRELFLEQSLQLIKKGKDNADLEDIKKEIETLEDKLIAVLFEEQTFIEHSNHNVVYCNLFIDVCSYFLNEYTKAKRIAKMIDFSDMEHFAIQILQANDQLIAKQYKQHFYEIMVDEFQDSNDVQDTLVKLICKQNNVFRVGDIKQSIYGFRHATPDIMRSLIDTRTENDEIIYLSNNYRSKKSIVDFNNKLFDTLMNINGFASTFSSHDCTKTGLDEQACDNVASELHLINDKSINKDRFQKLSKDELKAEYIADQIIKLKQQKGYAYKDFVVLIKTNAKSEFLREAFESLNIPYFINMKHGFYDSSALQNVVSYLKALNNPHDDLSFCALLLSPFFQRSDEDLAQIQLAKEKNSSYYSYMCNDNSMNDFNELLRKAKYQKISDTLQDIFYHNNYYEDYTTQQEKSNLDKLFEMVCTKESQGALSLFAFLNLIEESRNTQIGEAIPISSSDDVVRVMSIHQSKGLQFPIVFLYSIDSLNLFDAKGMVAFDDRLGIALNYMDMENRLVYTSIERLALNHKAIKAALEEEMRVLYVATTRAQKEMYIVDCKEEKVLRDLSKIEIYKKNSFTSWILQAYQHSDPQLFNIRYISDYWTSEVQPSLEAKQQTIAKYAFPVQTSSTLAPSDTEVFTFTPSAFHFNEDDFTKRGNDLHKMIEMLPDITWNQDMINSVAIMNRIHLSEHDYDVLLALSRNECYLDTQQADIYHEMPFMVEDHDTIIHGYMDYVAIDKNRVTLIDFKSDRNAKKDELLKRYSLQLETYKKALMILFPDKTINAYIYSFELQQMIMVF